MRVFIVLLSIVGAFCSSESSPTYLTVECEYKDYKHHFGTFYTCVGKGVHVSNDNTIINAVRGSHLSGKGDSDVQAIFFYGESGVHYVPQLQLDTIYPNLVAFRVEKTPVKTLGSEHFGTKTNFKFIHFDDNQIETVAQKTFYNMTNLEWLSIGGNRIHKLSDDLLRGLTNLKFFSASRNQIEVLGSSLFRDNTRLEEIHFYDNKIRMIGWKLVRLTTALKVARFDKNQCTNMSLSNDSEISDKLTAEFSTKCVVNCQKTISATKKMVSALKREEKKLKRQVMKDKREKQGLKMNCN